MRLLLVASNQYHKPWPVIPFGACSIAQAADVSGHEVRVLDLNFSSNTAKDIQDAIIPELKKQETDFICLNFANTDMVGHTGIMEAAKKAAEAVDSCLKNVVDTALENNYSSIIIADHGNSGRDRVDTYRSRYPRTARLHYWRAQSRVLYRPDHFDAHRRAGRRRDGTIRSGDILNASQKVSA